MFTWIVSTSGLALTGLIDRAHQHPMRTRRLCRGARVNKEPKAETRLRRNPQVLARQIGDELILVPVGAQIVEAQSLYTLNETGRFLWEQLEVDRSRTELVEALVAAFEVDRARAEEDLAGFLTALLREGCIQTAAPDGDEDRA
jgi:hypothetical protein